MPETNELGRLMIQLLSSPLSLTNSTYVGIPIRYIDLSKEKKMGQTSFVTSNKVTLPETIEMALDTNEMRLSREHLLSLYNNQQPKIGEIPFRPFLDNPALWNAHIVQHEYLHPKYPYLDETSIEQQAIRDAYQQWLLIHPETNTAKIKLESGLFE